MSRTVLPLVLLLAATGLAQAASVAGTIDGTVEEIQPDGRFFHITISASDPADLATVGERAKIMANWATIDGKLAPQPTDTARILGYETGQAVGLTVRRDAKHDGYRFVDPEKVAELNAEAERVAGSLFVPDEPRATDRSVITGADEAALAEREAAIGTVIAVAPEDDLVAKLQEAREHLLAGTPVKVELAAGTWSLPGHEPILIDDEQAKEAMLVIQGAGAGMSVIDFAGNGSKAPLLETTDKHYVVLRGFSLRNHADAPLVVGRYQPIRDNAQFLFEDLQVSGSKIGIVVFHVDGITIRNIDSSDNARTGLFIIARNAIIEDSVFSGNRGAGPGSFRGGIALAAKDCLIRRVRCDDNPERGSGLRMDHLCENVVIEDSSFNRNGSMGTIWETALGPCRIERSEMIDNRESGIALSSAYDFELIDCDIRDNDQAQILLQPKPRPVIDLKRGKKSGAYGAADIEAGVGEQWTNLKGMMGNRFFTVTGCTIATDDRDAAFYEHQYGKPEIYRELMTEQFTAADNTYRSPQDSRLFDTFQGPYSELELIDLEAWREWTGQEVGSTWEAR